MSPRPNDQPLTVAGCLTRSRFFHSQIIANSSAEEDVVPTAEVQGGDVNLRVVLFDRQFLPVLIEVGVCKPVVIILGKASV